MFACKCVVCELFKWFNLLLRKLVKLIEFISTLKREKIRDFYIIHVQMNSFLQRNCSAWQNEESVILKYLLHFSENNFKNLIYVI